jgi:hypothetical protein
VIEARPTSSLVILVKVALKGMASPVEMYEATLVSTAGRR